MEIKIKNLERRERKRNEKKTTGTHTIELKNNNVLSGILILHLLTFQMPIIYDNSAEGRIIDI